MMSAKHTPGPWSVVYYDAGDKDEWNDCPSIEAPEDQDCAVVHWAGFKQRYWTSARGDQRQIDANARLIAAAPTMHDYVAKRAAEGCTEAASILEAVNANS